MFATHYHELTELSSTCPYAVNYSVSARELGDDIVFLHKVSRGPASRSYGIAVAKLAGVPEVVLARAKAILGALEGGAALPSGKHATLRGRSEKGGGQLDLFGRAPLDDHGVLDTLKAVNTDRLTPLDALTLIAKLKSLLEK